MKRQFTSILLFSALLMGGASTFVSCTDHESDSAYNTSISFADAVEKQKQDLVSINNYLTQVKKYIKEDGSANDALIRAIEEQIKTNQTIIDQIKGYAKEEILGDAVDLNAAIKQTAAYKDIIKDLYGESGDAGMKKTLEDLEEIIKGADGQSGLSKKVEDINTWVEQEKLKNYLVDTDTLNLSNRTDTLSRRLDSEIANAKQWVLDKHYLTSDDIADKVTLDQVKEWYNETGINERLQGMSDSLKNISNSINDLLQNQVSGIIVQASESPVTGYENTPFGVQLGFIGAYYGHVEGGARTAFGNLTGTLISDADDNAGIIYVSVNPANVNPTSIDLRLVDSQGNIIGSNKADDKAPFTLEWANTDKVLKFGVSRAATTSKNGFYAVKVKLNKDNINDVKTWTKVDAQNLKSVGQNLLDKLKHPKTANLQLGNIVSTLNSTFNNRLTAYGLEASWIQRDLDGNTIENKKVTSKLSLAATAISPLSYEFLKDGIHVDLPTIPTLQSKINFSDYKFNWTPINKMDSIRTSITLSGMPDLDNIAINGSIVVPEVTPNITIKTKDGKTQLEGKLVDGKYVFDLDQLDASAKVQISDITVNKNNFSITIPQDKKQSYEVTIPMDSFNSIIDQINSQVGNMIGSVNDIVDQVSGYVESIDGNYIARINSYIKKFENLLTKSNSLLQPTIFYTTSEGSWNQLPTVEAGAAHLKLNGGKASTVFIASSYTAELLAPAYKKMITVDGGAQLTGVDAKGIMDGSKSKVGFTATKAGTYKITYTAVDYFGKQVSKDFFVKVVE